MTEVINHLNVAVAIEQVFPGKCFRAEYSSSGSVDELGNVRSMRRAKMQPDP